MSLIFKQSLPETDATKFDTIKEHFGVICGWDEVIAQLNELNSQVDSNEIQYKLFWQNMVKDSIMLNIMKTLNFGMIIGLI